MAQPGRDLDLAEEPLGAEGGSQVGAEHLEGDRPVELEVLGQVNSGHSAVPELPLNGVGFGEGANQGFISAATSRIPNEPERPLLLRLIQLEMAWAGHSVG